MRIVFSRKGFDTSAGGKPSPIVDGRPVSLPIPERPPTPTTYGDLGLGELVEQLTRGRYSARSHCHDDPMFADDRCWLGQCSAAQRHLAKNGVGVGDVFLFFGLFAEPKTGTRHHRIFGYMRVACYGEPSAILHSTAWCEPPRSHPHMAGKSRRYDTIYFGLGNVASQATPALRLTKSGGPLNTWTVPPWLQEHGLTYHTRPERWIGQTELDSAKRGQEFITNVGNCPAALQWVEEMISEIEQ